MGERRTHGCNNALEKAEKFNGNFHKREQEERWVWSPSLSTLHIVVIAKNIVKNTEYSYETIFQTI